MATADVNGQWVAGDERDAFISWLRGEFVAANAIIDALSQHIQQLGSPGEYDFVLNCIHQRRYNWNPVLHMQQYYSISEVSFALQQVALKRQQSFTTNEKIKDNGSLSNDEEANSNSSTTENDNSKETRTASPKHITGFEEIDGEQVNVMEGLELYENVFEAKEASDIAKLVSESHASKKKKGHKKSSKVKAKEVIHFGTIPSEIQTSPVFTEETAEPMPAYLESIIDRLLSSKIVAGGKRPDSCSISVLEPGDYMPPHKHNNFEQPLYILSLGSQSELKFGRSLKSGESDKTYKVNLPVGSVLVLKGNSAQLVQCSVPPLQSTRLLVTFGKMVKKPLTSPSSPSSPVNGKLMHNFVHVVPTRGLLAPAPVVIPVRTSPQTVAPKQETTAFVTSVAPYTPVTVVAPAVWSPPGITRVPSPGTGVFLPANNGMSTMVYSTNHHINGSHRRHAHHHHFEHGHASHGGIKEVAA